MSALCSNLKISQKSVLRRMLLQSPLLSLSESFAGICDALNRDIAQICSASTVIEKRLLARVA